MKDFILKKRSIWFHILVTYFTCGIWAIIYFACKYSTKTTYNTEIAQTNSKNFKTIKVAGVTFKNEDGTSRQEIIKTLTRNQKLKLVPYKYNDKDAIYVKTLDDKVLGNIPADKTSNLLNQISDNLISNVSVYELDNFINEKNQKIYYLKIKISA